MQKCSLRSNLFSFLLAGESESQGEVARTHGARAKRGTGGRVTSVPEPSRDFRLLERKRKRLLRRLAKIVWILTSCIIQVRKQKFAAMKSCDFKEEYSEGYFQYKSVKYPKWFIGFSRQGKPRSRRKGPTKHRYRHFIRYDVPDKTKRKHRRDAKHRKKNLIKFLERELLRRWNV